MNSITASHPPTAVEPNQPRAAMHEAKAPVEPFLMLQAYMKLMHFDIYLARGNFAALYNKVRKYPVAQKSSTPEAVDKICYAVDMACIWYWKEALCLQRSAALTCLLKRYGASAQMVIGAQHVPFKSHAWVEVDGRVVNDKPYVSEVYAVLDRC